MAAASKLRPSTDGVGSINMSFYCPGCLIVHEVCVRQGSVARPVWGFNHSRSRPTFTPSVLVRVGHYIPEHTADTCWCTYNAQHPDQEPDFTCLQCHSFVTYGRIQFLSDCSHPLAGQTVDLPDFPRDTHD